jgi:phosphoglycerate dehydrogenase-like enzyme
VVDLIDQRPSVIVDPWPRRMDEIFSPDAAQRLRALADVVWADDEPMPEADFAEALPDASVVVCSDWRAASCAVQDAERLRAVMGVSGAFPAGLDYEQCLRRGVRVLSCAPAFARQVAEMGLGLALAANRDIVGADQAMRRGEERYLHAGNVGTTLLYGKRIGLIGYGNIGRELRRLLEPFRCAVAAYDPWQVDAVLRQDDVRPTALEELLATSDVVFGLAAPSVENGALLSAERLALLREDALFVLLSRAQLVDFDALTACLRAGRFRAAIDVFPTEPLAAEHPIRSAPGTLLSAHRAGSVAEGLWEIGDMVLADLEAILRGLPPRFLQNGEPELLRRYATPDTTPAAVDDGDAR